MLQRAWRRLPDDISKQALYGMLTRNVSSVLIANNQPALTSSIVAAI